MFNVFRSHVYILIIGAWLFTTILVDFVAIPLVFRNLDDVMKAGFIGIKLFKTYNALELFFALCIVAFGPLWDFKKNNLWGKLMGLMTLDFLIIACVYLFWFSPEIAHNSNLMATLPEGEALVQAKAAHNFYHTWYIRLDSLKIIGLVWILIYHMYGVLKKKPA